MLVTPQLAVPDQDKVSFIGGDVTVRLYRSKTKPREAVKVGLDARTGQVFLNPPTDCVITYVSQFGQRTKLDLRGKHK